MRRIGALGVSLLLAACTAGPVSEPVSGTVVEPVDRVPEDGGPSHDPESLMAKDHESVRNLLGDPAFVWTEQGAEMWSYRGRACFVDVFFYDGRGVTYVDVRGEGYADCFRRLVEDHASG